MFKNVCLAGLPNSGKTTLYNLLTGSYERVGNRAGVTVDSKTGKYKKNKSIEITDLPGAYSLKGGSLDERVASDFIKDLPDVIVNVIDGNFPERSLKFTCELARLKVPMVVAVNFCDELSENGIKIDAAALSAALKVPVVMISARKNKNVDKLIDACKNAKIPAIKGDDKEFIANAVAKSVKRGAVSADFTDKADKVLLHRVFGIPIFIAVILAIYSLTSVIGGFFGEKISLLFVRLSAAAEKALTFGGAFKWFSDFVCNALIKGVGEVLSFLPQVLVLFFLLTVIEESGYLARAAFLLDGIMEKVGLGGKSLIALGVSCGCTVGGVMSARTVDGENQRRLTVFLAPFMPCGAKTAVFAWLSGLVFGGNPFITASLYFLSVFTVAVSGAFLKRFDRFRGGAGLIMEMPVLRTPSLRGTLGALKEKTVDFVLKAGSVIFVVSAVVWFLQKFGLHGYTENITESFLYFIGDKVRYVFVPLGFGNWQAAVSVIAGIFAKEAVIQTLSVVSEAPAALFYTPYSAYAFMAFILLMPPCTAALSAAKNELKDAKTFALMISFQICVAYLVALTINCIGLLIDVGVMFFISLTIVLIGFIISVITLVKKRRCSACAACGGEKCNRKKANTII